MNDVPDYGNGGDEACANCGKTGSDTVKLKNCTSCRLVKYCGVDCQKAHHKKHKKPCKQRAAELKDNQLYIQGHERPEGDFCPICTLPVPFPIIEHSNSNACCMKNICNGCNLAAKKRGMHNCPFCRAPCPDNDADILAMVQARVEKKDPEAINSLGKDYYYGMLGLQKDTRKAFELYTEAAKRGSVEALFNIAIAYELGEGVEQDETKSTKFYEKAAMQGHVDSRHNLGCSEEEKGNYDNAVRHFLISAKMGYEHSFETIKDMFVTGQATKEQYAQAVKGYQDAAEEMDRHITRRKISLPFHRHLKNDNLDL